MLKIEGDGKIISFVVFWLTLLVLKTGNAVSKEMEKFADEQAEATKEELKKQTEEALKEVKETVKNATLENVYKVTEKWLGIKIKDRKRIDVILATVLSNQIPGTPLWLFIVGASGDWKSAFCRSLEKLHNVIKIDQLTKNTLASGQKDAEDLGKELEHSSKILLFLDLASLTSANNDEKNIIWGQFRTLYDGDIYKRTGNSVTKAYEGCHVTIIACTTNAIRNEILIHAQLGTREVMYDTCANPIDNDFKMDKAIQNEKYEEQMQNEIGKAVQDFLTYHKVKDIKISEENINFLKSEAKRCTILRASGMVDKQYKELLNPIDPEVPTRLIKQLIRLWRCLKSLDDDYPDEKAKEIITHIVNSSGDKVRQMVLELLQNNPDDEFKITDVQHHTRLGRKTVKAQLEMLWNLKVIDKETREERIGGYVYTDDLGNEMVRGGRIEKIPFYRYRPVTPNSPPTHETQNTLYIPRGETGGNRFLEGELKPHEQLQKLKDFCIKEKKANRKIWHDSLIRFFPEPFIFQCLESDNLIKLPDGSYDLEDE